MKNSAWIFILLALALGRPSFGQAELVGELFREEILKDFPDWQAVIDSYVPDFDIIDRLREVNEEIEVEVFLGTWCPDSKKQLGAYFKILDIVDNPLIKTRYIGIPRNRDDREIYIKGRDIVRIPTFIVSIQKQERGRIIETPQASVEEDLWKIILERR